MASASCDKLPVDWELLCKEGPSLTNHAGCVIANRFYIHGGVTKYGNTSPSNKLYMMELTSARWVEITEPGSPTLSHHACVALENRYMILIGGWDGRQRVSKIYAFDTQEKRWLQMTDSGFPDGAGLSSHSATVLCGGEILIIGREGSLRIQRKHGNVYLLTGSVLSGKFTYRKMTNATASRSGHSMHCVGKNLYIMGGRDDNFVEFHSGYSSYEPTGTLASKLSEMSFKPITKPPSGRKNHTSFVCNSCIIVHGGETFDGRSREPVGEMFLISTKPHLTYHKIGNSSVCRASHVSINTGDRIIFHGGIAGKNVVYGDTYELKLRS
ncbi:Kelch domain-containing protein 9 [Mactra antiquata]